MKRYAALFYGPDDEPFSVGPFDTPAEAAEYGEAHDTDIIRFTGDTAEVMTPGLFERYVVGQQLRAKAEEFSPSNGHWVGEITRCDDGARYGFITSSGGKSWFFSRAEDQGHDLGVLALGEQVTFTGSPSPPPGQRHPTAYTIRPLADAVESTS